jgi:hypothetical protein
LARFRLSADREAKSAEATLLAMLHLALSPTQQVVALFRSFLFLAQQSGCSLSVVKQIHFLTSVIGLFSLLHTLRLMQSQQRAITE